MPSRLNLDIRDAEGQRLLTGVFFDVYFQLHGSHLNSALNAAQKPSHSSPHVGLMGRP